ncbi:MAG TPA: ABC transporter permease [Actinophytocola sp.]|uniref:ABC transporter permease n=1 Tax=Actinophytocola sp. TaxID=1872138 RepID=UPI002DDCBA34|nr:ABC transporter permease [Actinophytocola sp.]HEV2782194.1 ABC transporter permease [Actinophytocola sp.]
MDEPISVGPVLVAVLVLLTAVGAVVVWVGRVGAGRSVVVAAVRAAVQLAAVSLLIAAVLRSAWWTGLFVLMMFTVAAITSARRIGGLRSAWRAAAPIGCGVAPVLALLLSTGTVATRPVVLIPVAGILIGGAMTATSLAGVRALDELRARHGEYEAALALGFMPRAAALEICRGSAGQALIPVLDQTRTVGLVTLPGAFVGVLLGGGDPIQAGITQLLVLIALLAAEAVAVLLTVELVAAEMIGRMDRGEVGRIARAGR